MYERVWGLVLSLMVLAVTASPLLAQDGGAPPPFVPWWLSPFSYAPDHMKYLPAGSAILEKVRGVDRYRIIAQPGATTESLPQWLGFVKIDGMYKLRELRSTHATMLWPDTIVLVKTGKKGVYEYVRRGNSSHRLPTAIAAIRMPARDNYPPLYQFAIRGGNIQIANPPLTPQRPSNPRPNWRGSANDVARGTVVREVGGLAQFAAAYLVKEGVKAALTGDAEVMKQAVRQMGARSFWASLGVFTIASGATDFAIRALPLNGTVQAISRSVLPLAAGMAAIQVLRGEASAKSMAISMGAYVAAGWMVGSVADTTLYLLLFEAGPPGWFAAGVYTVGKLAATLYVGEKIEEWLNRVFNRRHELREVPSHRGVADQIERLSEVND